jgi:hypothetical protein
MIAVDKRFTRSEFSSEFELLLGKEEGQAEA